jgi:hypothetical protein
VPDLRANDFQFRGSLGNEMCGHEAFKEYVLSVRKALADYTVKSLFALPKDITLLPRCAFLDAM